MSTIYPPHYSWPIYASLSVALFIALMPIAGWVHDFMPNLVLMAIVYWAIYRPDVMGLGTAWVVGIIHDSLTISMIGQHALIYVTVVFVINSGSVKTKNYAFLEYMTWLTLFIVFDVVMSVFFNRIFQQTEFEWQVLFSILGGIIIWPWLYVLLNYFENIAAEKQQ